MAPTTRMLMIDSTARLFTFPSRLSACLIDLYRVMQVNVEWVSISKSKSREDITQSSRASESWSPHKEV